jgi:hypothetical protein
MLVMTFFAVSPVAAQGDQEGGVGPEITAFLDFIRQEEEELEFQISHEEISRKDYVRAKNRFSVMRQTVLDIVHKTGKDIVPELQVVTTAEIYQVLDGGIKSLRGIKPGGIVEEKWRYLGRATKGEVFYIFERIKKR